MRTERRLRKASDFQRLTASGRRARSDGITVFVAARDAAGAPSRAGLAVRLRGGTAVARNRVRRRLHNALAEVGPPTGWDVVVRADGEVAGKSFQEIRNELGRALQRAGVLS